MSIIIREHKLKAVFKSSWKIYRLISSAKDSLNLLWYYWNIVRSMAEKSWEHQHCKRSGNTSLFLDRLHVYQCPLVARCQFQFLFLLLPSVKLCLGYASGKMKQSNLQQRCAIKFCVKLKEFFTSSSLTSNESLNMLMENIPKTIHWWWTRFREAFNFENVERVRSDSRLGLRKLSD